jgi:hypothetical protein
MNGDMGGVSKKAMMAESRRYLEICLDGLRKNIKIPDRVFRLRCETITSGIRVYRVTKRPTL